MDPILGSIIMFGGNFAPRGWAFCDGQLLSISQNSALFSLLGTSFGGNGTTTFGLPDLRGRLPMHAGNGPGLTPRSLGESGGAETATLSIANMASHTHSVRVRGEVAPASTANPTDAMFAAAMTYAPDTAATEVLMNGRAVQENPVGSNQPFATVSPFQCVNFIIALEGVYPSRP